MREAIAIANYQISEENGTIILRNIKFIFHNFVNWDYEIAYHYLSYQSYAACMYSIIKIAKANNIRISITKDGDFYFPDIYFSTGINTKHYALSGLDIEVNRLSSLVKS